MMKRVAFGEVPVGEGFVYENLRFIKEILPTFGVNAVDHLGHGWVFEHTDIVKCIEHKECING